MKKATKILAAIVGILSIGFLFRYGTLSPYGALKKQLKTQLISSAVTDPATDAWGRAGQGLGLALAGPMIDNMVDTLTPMQCVRALYQLEVEGESILLTPTRPTYSTDHSTESSAPLSEKREWRTREESSPIDDSKNTYLSIEADKPVSGWLDKHVRPVLMIRCKEKTIDVLIILGMRPKTEYGTYGSEHTRLTLRFDKEDAFQERLGVSTDGEAVFFPDHASYVKRMLAHKCLLVEFTPSNASPQITTFNLEGLSEKIGPLREACDW